MTAAASSHRHDGDLTEGPEGLSANRPHVRNAKLHTLRTLRHNALPHAVTEGPEGSRLNRPHESSQPATPPDPPSQPWGDLKGRPLDARGLARLLDPCDITPAKVKVRRALPPGLPG